MEKKENFLILRKVKYGESDLILQALSPRGERVSFIAKGALRSRKRFGGGVLEPAHFVQFTYQDHGSIGKLNYLREASLIEDFHGIRCSYEHLEFALRVLECAYKVSLEGDDNSDGLYNLVGHTLRELQANQNLGILKMQFMLKFLLQQGVLVIEPWMKPFLRAKLTESQSLVEFASEVPKHEFTMTNILDNYLARAET